MKKLGCASCGGTMKKMSKGGTTKNVNISKPGAGYAKRTVGGDNQKMNMYGIAQTGQGQMDGKTGVMKKGGSVKKEHPITAFRKANETRQAAVKSSMKKMQTGGKTTSTPFQGYMKTPGAVASDTVAMTNFGGRRSTTSMGPMDIKAKNPKNQKALENAYIKTYGDDIKGRYTDPQQGETNDQYNRRMGPSKKTGGTVKSKKK